ncbi:MAG: DUF2357 domain-containing protein [Kofleriaceae bacterium]|nr:DUF2357 domain-containing protein [Kofleriaceae bacterium]
MRLAFGNAVGLYRTSCGVILEAHSGKWDASHFDMMLTDVVSICADLPLSTSGDAGALPYQQTDNADEQTRYHAFVYLRHILRDDAVEPDRLATSIESILREPHRRLEIERERVQLERARVVDTGTVHALARSTSFVRAHGLAGQLPLSRALRGHLPAAIEQPRSVRDLDTLENRFVRSFLRGGRRVVDDVKDRVASGEAGYLRARLHADCEWMTTLLDGWLRHPLWDDVGDITQLPLASTVLQGRRGYRDVLRHHVRMMLATQALPLSALDTFALLEARNIAVMYELWTYFTVVAELRKLLGHPARADRITPAFWGPNVRQGFQVRWATGHRVTYNETFVGRTQERSYSTELRPDVTLWCPSGACHLLDAKFKVSDQGSFKNDDVQKMHAYRDAIRDARSSWVLYPGDLFDEFGTNDVGIWGAVGAVPLRPETTGYNELQTLLSRLIAV